MDSVASAENAPLRILRHVRLVDVPDRRPLDVRLDRRIADQNPDLLSDVVCREIWLSLVDVETPAGDPLRPRPHGAEKAHADLAEARVRRDDPVQDAGTMFAVPGEVGVEDRVDSARTRHATFDRKLEMIDHGRSRAVGADYVPRSDGKLPSVQPIAQRGGDAVGVLLMTDVLGVALLCRLLKQNRLEQWLDDIHHAARTCPQIVAPAVVPGPPRPHPDEFVAGQAGGERRVSHQFPRAGVSGHVLRDSEVPEDFVGALVRDVSAGAIGHPIAARHEVTAHAGISERQGSRRAGRTRPDDQHVCFVCHVCLRGCSPHSHGKIFSEKCPLALRPSSPCRRSSRGWLRRIPAPW